MPQGPSKQQLESETFLQNALDASFAACDGAKKILNSHFGNLRNLSEKFHAGLVSDADRESETFIVNLIRTRFPQHVFLGEESGLSGSNEMPVGGALWMIDPLDGTTNFVHQFPFFCISIGLELDGELVVGVVDAPMLGQRWHAIKGQGAYLNGQKIRVSSRMEFREGLFATGFSNYDDELEQQLALCAHTIREARGIRRAGAAALDLCYVAQGVFDCFWEKNLAPWDMAAGVVIAREAGAVVTDLNGKAFDSRGKSVACGSPMMHAEIIKARRALSHSASNP